MFPRYSNNKDYEECDSGQVVECPICMDEIDLTRNCVTTECGHKFHAKCLMQNVAHNGFSCPNCRAEMAEVEKVNDDDYYDDGGEEEEEEEEDNEDFYLKGMRWLFQRVLNEELDDFDYDIDEEEDFLYQEQEQDEDDEEFVAPTVTQIVTNLTGLGITFEDVVKSILNDNHEEYSMSYDRLTNDIHEKIRTYVTNYNYDNQRHVEHEVPPLLPFREIIVDDQAQPKV